MIFVFIKLVKEYSDLLGRRGSSKKIVTTMDKLKANGFLEHLGK